MGQPVAERKPTGFRESLRSWAEANQGSRNPAVKRVVEEVWDTLDIEDEQAFLERARIAFNSWLTDTDPHATDPTPLDQLHAIVIDISRELGW